MSDDSLLESTCTQRCLFALVVKSNAVRADPKLKSAAIEAWRCLINELRPKLLDFAKGLEKHLSAEEILSEAFDKLLGAGRRNTKQACPIIYLKNRIRSIAKGPSNRPPMASKAPKFDPSQLASHCDDVGAAEVIEVIRTYKPDSATIEPFLAHILKSHSHRKVAREFYSGKRERWDMHWKSFCRRATREIS